MVSASEYVMIGVSNMDEALSLFHDTMQLTVEADYFASASLKQAWGIPELRKAHIVELSCRGYPAGRVRLISYDPVPEQKVRVHHGDGPHDSATDIGCKAIDFYVNDPIKIRYNEIIDAGYETRSEPVLHEVGDNISEEFVFWGPDGVPLLLMVGHKHGSDQLRAGSPNGPYSEIATVSVVGADIDRTCAFYTDILGLKLIIDNESTPDFVELVNKLTGTPAGTNIHWHLFASADEASGKILVVHFPGAEAKRLSGRMRPGHLGFSLLSHSVDDLGALHDDLSAAGYGIMTPPTEVDYAGSRKRIMIAHGPNEELFEFVER